MMKKFITSLLALAMVATLVGCADKQEKQVETKQRANVEEKRMEEGSWVKEFTKNELIETNKEIINRVEELVLFYGLEYIKEEKVKEENGETINDNYIYVDNLNPEPNRMESMYYGVKIYGTDMSKGKLGLKIGFNLDTESIKTSDEFKFEETSMAEFVKAVTGIEDRDYSELNEQIVEAVKSGNKNESIENNLDGLIETITIKDNFLLYKLESNMYDLKNK